MFVFVYKLRRPVLFIRSFKSTGANSSINFPDATEKKDGGLRILILSQVYSAHPVGE